MSERRWDTDQEPYDLPEVEALINQGFEVVTETEYRYFGGRQHVCLANGTVKLEGEVGPGTLAATPDEAIRMFLDGWDLYQHDGTHPGEVLVWRIKPQMRPVHSGYMPAAWDHEEDPYAYERRWDEFLASPVVYYCFARFTICTAAELAAHLAEVSRETALL